MWLKNGGEKMLLNQPLNYYGYNIVIIFNCEARFNSTGFGFYLWVYFRKVPQLLVLKTFYSRPEFRIKERE